MRALICFIFSVVLFTQLLSQVNTLSIGSKAPDFKLKSVNGKKYSLKNFKKADVLVVIFTCNHCPTAQAYEDRFIKLDQTYKSKSVQIVAISPNDPKAVRLDELGYTDLNDTYEQMKIRDEQKQFPFPYLYDGDAQVVAKAYGPVATPHLFIFDKNRVLQYQGRFDDMENPNNVPKSNDAINAIDDLLNNRAVGTNSTKVFGCSIKWASKSSWLEDYKKKWSEEQVNLEVIDDAGLKTILHNNSDKLRFINVWATWCGPCVTEFSDLIEIFRMYRGRDFEFITISADHVDKKDKVLKFLKEHQASGTNFIYNSDDKYQLIEAIDPSWQGALPYTLIVEPGGNIVKKVLGQIDAMEMKTTVVNNRFIGRYF